MIKHFQNEGWIERTCIFEVKRLQKETKREVQILSKSQVTELFLILEIEYKYLIPVVKKVMAEKIKLADVLKTETQYSYRRIRKDFFKIKQKLGLEKFMFDDLRFS